MLVDRVHPILLIEDEADDASFVHRAFEKASIKNPLVVYKTGAAAREALSRMQQTEYPALIIVDIFLPGRESGLDFLEWLRRQPAPVGEIAAMIYSVSADAKHFEEARALGSVVFLRKPVTEKALSDAAQALGFVILTSREGGGRMERVIAPRQPPQSAGR
jgi:CheY-like chemotaxis protein